MHSPTHFCTCLALMTKGRKQTDSPNSTALDTSQNQFLPLTRLVTNSRIIRLAVNAQKVQKALSPLGAMIGTTIRLAATAIAARTMKNHPIAEPVVRFTIRQTRIGIMNTPEISVLQAQKEIALFGENTRRMFAQVKDLYETEDEQAFGKLFERIHKGEEGSDRMENEIGRYLGDVGAAHLSDETKEKIRSMLRQIGELESVGDSCFNLARILRRKRENRIAFTPQMDEGIRKMFSLVEEALERMNALLSGHKEDYGIAASEEIERRINACRNAL